jgi:hypothetical protein
MLKKLTLEQAFMSNPRAVKAFVNDLACELPLMSAGDALEEACSGRYSFYVGLRGRPLVVMTPNAMLQWYDDSCEWLPVTED